jgi:hypothetical protein
MYPTSAAVETLGVPGALLHYEVRGHGSAVVLVGAPMDARPFTALADLLADDYTVLTTDPRGINRSLVDDPGQDSTPELRADDSPPGCARSCPGTERPIAAGGLLPSESFLPVRPRRVATAI